MPIGLKSAIRYNKEVENLEKQLDRDPIVSELYYSLYICLDYSEIQV